MASWVWPCPSTTRITSNFGSRGSPGGIGSTNHMGVDIGGASGAPIVAARPGRVTVAGWVTGYGNAVYMDHGGGITTRYAHMIARPAVTVGQVVKAGQRIGNVGATGNVTGPHLHFEIRVNGTAVDPIRYMNGSYTVERYTESDTGGGTTGGSSATVDTPTGVVAVAEAIARKNISDVVVKSTTGNAGDHKYSALVEEPNALDAGVEILIQYDKVYLPVIADTVTIEWERRGSPGKLKFSVVKTAGLAFHEGNSVRVRVDGEDIFFGYIFEKSRSLKAGSSTIDVTAYDQLRYFMNNDTFHYENKTYTELLKEKIDEFKLTAGEIVDTEWKIEKRTEEGALIDSLYYAGEVTTLNNGNVYVLYDDYGKICLQTLDDMMTDVLIDATQIGGGSYTSSIDKETYNKIVLAYDNDETGERELYITQDEDTQRDWGILQYYENVPDGETSVLSERGKVTLDYYNRLTRRLKVTDAIGSFKVRGGSMITAVLNLGDMILSSYILVEKVVHKFNSGKHLMDLTLVGPKGEFTT